MAMMMMAMDRNHGDGDYGSDGGEHVHDVDHCVYCDGDGDVCDDGDGVDVIFL